MSTLSVSHGILSEMGHSCAPCPPHASHDCPVVGLTLKQRHSSEALGLCLPEELQRCRGLFVMRKEVRGLLLASTSRPGKECDFGPERSFQSRTLPAVYPETRGSHSADGKHGESTTALAVTRVGE